MAFGSLRVVGVVASVIVLLAGCGGDDGSGSSEASKDAPSAESGGMESFCESAQALSDSGGIDLTKGADAVIAAVRSMGESAPPELEGDFTVFLDGLDSVSDLEADDPAALAAIVALVGDREFATSVNRIRDAAQEECGVDIEVTTQPVGE